MTEKDLIKKLNSLGQVNIDPDFKARNREILLAQISNSSVDYRRSKVATFFLVINDFFKAQVAQPLAIGGLIVFFFLGVAVYGHNLLPVGPNNSLFLAKTLSERARLSVAFGAADKARLEKEFALDHLASITASLNDPALNNNPVAVAKLKDSLKTELSNIKDNLKVDENVYNTSFGKDKSGLTIEDLNKLNATSTASTSSTTNSTTKKIVDKAVDATKACTSTTESLGAQKIKSADEAGVMLDQGDYKGAADKLQEILK